ncbi:MAG: hypothetical protein K6G38_01670 [Gammaproteobacteria bacterium]|nr:hypothetical protein [Gammaproteobacteria bacterium]
MDSFVEQVVKSKKYAAEKRRSKVFLVLMIIFLVVFVLLEIFGLTVSQIYYYTDRELFWYFMLYFVLAALPIIIMEVILFVLRRRLCVSYDYSFDGTEFKIIKSINGKRRRLAASFKNDSVMNIGRVDSEGYHFAFTPGQKRKPVICALNIDNPNIYYVRATALVNGISEQHVIVIEPKKELLDYLLISCPHVRFSNKDAWKE